LLYLRYIVRMGLAENVILGEVLAENVGISSYGGRCWLKTSEYRHMGKESKISQKTVI